VDNNAGQEQFASIYQEAKLDGVAIKVLKQVQYFVSQTCFNNGIKEMHLV
jgi:hypothetical protein